MFWSRQLFSFTCRHLHIHIFPTSQLLKQGTAEARRENVFKRATKGCRGRDLSTGQDGDAQGTPTLWRGSREERGGHGTFPPSLPVLNVKDHFLCSLNTLEVFKRRVDVALRDMV